MHAVRLNEDGHAGFWLDPIRVCWNTAADKGCAEIETDGE